MPMHNAAPFVALAVESVLAQRGCTLELIVVDDGSTDDGAAALAPYGDRITLIRQDNQGVGAARNAGLRLARGEFIAFLDADDVWLPGKLAAQLAHLRRNPDLGMVYGAWHCWDGEAPAPQPAPAADAATVARESGRLYPHLLLDCFILTSTVLLRREVAEAVGTFDPALKRGEDYDYWLRVAQRYRIDKLDRLLTLYRIHAANSASKYPNENYELTVVKRHAPPRPDVPLRRALRRRMSALCFGYGYGHYWRGDARRARASFREALRYRPWQPRLWVYLVLSHLRPAPAA